MNLQTEKNYRRNIHQRSISVGDSVGKLITDEICVLHRRKNSIGKTVKSCSGISSVIYWPTSSPTDSVRRLSLHRWFPIPSLYRSEKQKNYLPMVLQTTFARQKKSFPLEIHRRIFIPSVISWFTDGYVSSVKLSVSVWNTDWIYPFVNSLIGVAATVKCRRIKSVGKAIGECLKYRPNISICKCVDECNCQMPTDSFRW